MEAEKNLKVISQHVEAADNFESAHLTNEHDHQETKWLALRRNPWASGWCIFAVWTVLLVSYENNASGSVLGIPAFRKDFGTFFDGNYVIDAGWQAAFGGGSTAASAVGGICAGQMADWVGRRYTLMAMLALSYVSITLEFVATTNQVFFGGKLLNGFVVGVIATVSTTYIGELTPLALRGLMTCLNALAYTVGPFVCSLILNSTGTVDSPWAYRAIFCSQFGFLGVATLCIPFMPESPWWLMSKGKREKALKSLQRLGYNGLGAEKRLEVIAVTLEKIRQETDSATYLKCFRKSNFRRTFVSIAPLNIQAIGGVLFIATYSTYYEQLVGYSTADSFKLYIGLSVLSIVGNVCSWDLIDRLGRRFLTVWGSVSLTILLMVVGGLATVGTLECTKGAIALMLLYAFVYNITLGATAFSLLTEVATARLRVKTFSIGIMTQSLWYTMWSLTLPYLFNPDHANLGAKVRLFRLRKTLINFSCSALLTLFIVGFLHLRWPLYPLHYLSLLLQVETAGRSYEELDELFMKKVPAKKFKRYVTETEIQGQQAEKRVAAN